MRAIVGGLLALAAASAQASTLHDLRLTAGPEGTRVVLDLGVQSNYSIFTLANPDRVVIDLPGVQKAGALVANVRPAGVVKDIRKGPRDGGTRLVFDVSSPVTPASFGMPPGGGYGYRLIVDLTVPGQGTPPLPAVAAAAPPALPAAAPAPVATATPGKSNPAAAIVSAAATGPAPVAKPIAPASPLPAASVPDAPATRGSADRNGAAASPAAPAASVKPELALRTKPIVIAVDPGHGGEDPGAHGPDGVLEKNVTLAIARRLAALVDAQPGMHAVLTRDGDYYVGLRERTEKAREAQADLFVSIHCNAMRNDAQMHGTEVYVLSDHGASNEEARWIANRENAADLVGGVDLHDKDNETAAVLIDISQTATMEASFDLGNRLLDSIGHLNVLNKPQVQQAGFMVLKSPDIPSVLVETDYISNPREERLLDSSSYQQDFASSLLGGIRGYFSHYRPQQQMVGAPEAEQGRPHTIPVNLAGGLPQDAANGRRSELNGE